MSLYAVSDTQLNAIAQAIQLKTDNPAPMSVDDMPMQIGLIEGGGLFTDLAANVPLYNGCISTDGGIAVQTANKEIYTDYIPVISGLQILIIVNYGVEYVGTQHWCGIGVYDENHVFLRRLGSVLTASATNKGYIGYLNGTNAMENAAYVRVSARAFGLPIKIQVIQPTFDI